MSTANPKAAAEMARRISTVRAELEQIASAQVDAGLDHAAVLAVVKGVRASLPMQAPEGEPSLTSWSGLDAQTVLDVIARHGTFRSHRNKTLQKPVAFADPDEVTAEGNLPGFAAVLHTPEGTRKRLNKSKVVIVLPDGVARRGPQRRDVSKAYGAIVFSDPSDDERDVALWLARHNPAGTQQPLTFTEVAYVHFVTSIGLVEDLVGVCQPETTNRNAAERAAEQANVAARARLFANAYDLLETARTDAARAVRLLASADTSDLDAVRDALVTARWVHEGVMRDLSRALDYAMSTPGRERELAARMRSFALTVKAAPETYLPPHIGALSQAQVLRIAQAAGLSTEDLGPLKDTIRRGLDSLGLATERNRLLPEALACYQAGQEEAFWRAAARLAAADPAWRTELDDVLAGAIA